MDQPSASPPTSAHSGGRYIAVGIGAALLVLLAVVAYITTPHRPPPPCQTSELQLKDVKLVIQSLPHKPGAPLAIPANRPGTAFWIEGTNAHYVFALSPTGQNISLDQLLAVGDPLTINWGDCSSDEYAVASLASVVPPDEALLDQARGEVTVFVARSVRSPGWVIEGARPESLTPQAAEPTNPNAVQADVSFLGQAASADGKTLVINIEIRNTGTKPINLSEGGITLTASDGTAAQPEGVQPALPLDIQPEQSQPITLSFAKPAGNVATLKLLDFSVDLYY